jgi:hypothetical protein
VQDEDEVLGGSRRVEHHQQCQPHRIGQLDVSPRVNRSFTARSLASTVSRSVPRAAHTSVTALSRAISRRACPSLTSRLATSISACWRPPFLPRAGRASSRSWRASRGGAAGSSWVWAAGLRGPACSKSSSGSSSSAPPAASTPPSSSCWTAGCGRRERRRWSSAPAGFPLAAGGTPQRAAPSGSADRIAQPGGACRAAWGGCGSLPLDPRWVGRGVS